MNKVLSRTFNLTAILFLLVWAPFFTLSILDLKYNIMRQAGIEGVNFGLRCTLLILGSAKPVLYMLCLKKFRMAIRHTSIRNVVKEMVKRKLSDTKPINSLEGSIEGTTEVSSNVVTSSSDGIQP